MSPSPTKTLDLVSRAVVVNGTTVFPDFPEFSDWPVPIKLVSDPVAYVGMVTFALLNVISWIAVILRFISRRLYGRLGWDDWTLLLAQLLFTTCASGFFGLEVLAFHRPIIPMWQFDQFIILTFVAECFYTSGMVVFKISLSIFFWRILKDSRRRWILAVILFLNVTLGIAKFFVVLFQCGTPSKGPTLALRKLSNVCQPRDYLLGPAYAHGVINALTDIILCILPIPLVWRSKISRREKKVVTCIFALAGIGSIASIVRLGWVYTLAANGPSFWDTLQPLGALSAIELGMGITSVSLVTLRPLFRHFRRYLRTHASSSGSSSGQKQTPECARSPQDQQSEESEKKNLADKNFIFSATDKTATNDGFLQSSSDDRTLGGNNFLHSATDPRSTLDKRNSSDPYMLPRKSGTRGDFLLSASDADSPDSDDLEKGLAEEMGISTQHTGSTEDPTADLRPVEDRPGSGYRGPRPPQLPEGVRATWWGRPDVTN